MPDSSFTTKLSAEVIGLATSAVLTPNSVEAAKLSILDTLGVVLAGAACDDARPTLEMVVAERSAPQEATVWGTGVRVPTYRAALANGVAGHVMDYDDTSPYGGGHHGSIVVPVALAVGEAERATSAELLAAVICGYQVAGEVGRHFKGRYSISGSATCGLFGGVAAAARLMSVTPDVADNALRIAASFVSSTEQYLVGGGDHKFLQHGWAAQSAIHAASLARHGAIGARQALEGEFGVWQTFVSGFARPESLLEDDLWQVRSVEMPAVKTTPACHGILPYIPLWSEIKNDLNQDGLSAEDITDITCLADAGTARYMLDPIELKRVPESLHQARFSLPWCLGKLAFDGQLDISSFTAETLTNDWILKFASMVGWELAPLAKDEGFLRGGLRVAVKDGRSYERLITVVEGDDLYTIDAEQVTSKFMKAGASVGSPRQLQAIADKIWTLDADADTDAFFKMLGELRGARIDQPLRTS